MATKDKLINLEDLKVLSDHVEGDVTDLKSDINALAYVALSTNFEQGVWENNAKRIEAKRIRYKDRVPVSVGDSVFFENPNGLYYSVAVFENETSTTALETSGWIQEPYTIKNNGFLCLSVANGVTYNTSTNITPSDITTSIVVYKNGTVNFLDYLTEDKFTGIGYLPQNKYGSANIDVTIDVADDAKYLYIVRDAITFDATSTSFAVLDVTTTSRDIIRERGSQSKNEYIIPLDNIEQVRIVYHTTSSPHVVSYGFIFNYSLLNSVLDGVLKMATIDERIEFLDGFALEESDTSILDGLGNLLPFREARGFLGTGTTIQSVVYDNDYYYVLSSEQSKVLKINAKTKAITTTQNTPQFGHGISMQPLGNDMFCVASVDENDANRNIYMYNFTANAVTEYFTPSLDDEVLMFAWQLSENEYYIIASESMASLANIKAYLYNKTDRTKELIGTYTLPKTYVQGGCICGNLLYLSVNDGWNNTGNAYVLVFDKNNLSLIKTIMLSGIFMEVEGFSVYTKYGNVYACFGEAHQVKIYDAKLM